MQAWYEVTENKNRIARMLRDGELNEWQAYAELMLFFSPIDAARTVGMWVAKPHTLEEKMLLAEEDHAKMLRKKK